jgi:hypothetical protein
VSKYWICFILFYYFKLILKNPWDIGGGLWADYIYINYFGGLGVHGRVFAYFRGICNFK